ncbi:cyclic nucleotide-binding domain-containing protein [Desulfococcaceae bacterium HSG9]|nr:cyclic nucleotide-binding domain-containing protein [Desulfococcaceae bacterium HSG9]
MFAIEDLKQIVILNHLNDEMLAKLIPITELLLFDDKEIIFRQGDRARRLYMLLHGKVLLEQRLSDQITVSVSAIKPGFTFGWSAMLDEDTFTSDAICAESCKAFSFRQEKIKALLDQDHSLGYLMSQGLLRILKKRLDTRTGQFVKTIKHHPDLLDLL